MIIQFQQRKKPTVKQVWREVYKSHPAFTITSVKMMKLPYELPVWTVEFEVEKTGKSGTKRAKK